MRYSSLIYGMDVILFLHCLNTKRNENNINQVQLLLESNKIKQVCEKINIY